MLLNPVAILLPPGAGYETCVSCIESSSTVEVD